MWRDHHHCQWHTHLHRGSIPAGRTFSSTAWDTHYVPPGLWGAKTAKGGAVLFSVALTTSAAVQLVTLRATLTIGGQSVTMMHDGYHFKVTNCSIMCHASNMLIWTSALPNAGQGAFVRSRLAHQLADPFIRKDEVICGYSSSNITDSELASLNTWRAGVLPDNQGAVAQ